jgi:hypothetical protein
MESAADTWVLTLKQSYETTAQEKFSSGIRRDIRYSMRKGVIVTSTPSRDDTIQFTSLWNRCYDEGNWNGVRLCRNFFLGLSDLFPDRAKLVLAKSGNSVIGGGLFLDEAEGAVYYAGAFDRDHKSAFPMCAVLDHTIRNLCANGKKYLNFGGIGLSDKLASFKSRWGAEPLPVYRLMYTRGSFIGSKNRTLLQRLSYRVSAAFCERLRRGVSGVLAKQIARPETSN